MNQKQKNIFKKIISVRFPDPILKKLKKVARKETISVSALIRRTVIGELEAGNLKEVRSD